MVRKLIALVLTPPLVSFVLVSLVFFSPEAAIGDFIFLWAASK
jgi:hypothetical protein